MSAMSEKGFNLAELFRRTENIVKRGKVSEVDTEAARVRVTVGEAETDWVPWLALRAGSDRTWWAPSVGEQVLLISESGELRNGVALVGFYQNEHPAPDDDPDIALMEWEDGARVSYNRATHAAEIELPAAGEFVVRVGRTTFSLTDNKVFIKTPAVEVQEG